MRHIDAKADWPYHHVARIAARQHGVISVEQLREAGVTKDAVRRRVESGALHRVHRGVYAVGNPVTSWHGRWMAATLACGGGAVVSHRSAADLWQLLKTRSGPVAVTVPTQAGRGQRKGIRLHRSATLAPAQATRRLRIPVTTPARTISDLRRVAPGWELRRAIRQAEVLGLPLGDDVMHDGTRSDLEREFLRICRRHRLPRPEVNVPLGPYLADFLWPDRGLVVETDHYRYHRGKQGFRQDRARDLELRARGFEVIRLSEEQIDAEPERIAAILHEVLASRPHRVGPDGGQET